MNKKKTCRQGFYYIILTREKYAHERPARTWPRFYAIRGRHSNGRAME